MSASLEQGSASNATQGAIIFRTEASTAFPSLSIISLAFFVFFFLPLMQPHDLLPGRGSFLAISPHFTPDEGSPASEAQEPRRGC
jgi:hypothetical protein